MHTHKQCKEPPTKVAAFICRVMSDNEIRNPKQLAEVSGMNQPTIHRILSGEIKEPTRKTLEPFLKRFGLKYAQVIGDEFYAPVNPDERRSAKADEIARKWDALEPEAKRCISALVDILSGDSIKNGRKANVKSRI